MSAIGNQKPEDLGTDPITAIHWGFAIAAILSVPAHLLFCALGSAGYLYWRLSYLIGVSLPMVVATFKRRLPDQPPDAEDGLCVLASGLLLVLFLLHALLAQRNRGREHSLFTGRTWFCSKTRPTVEFVLAMGLSLLLQPIAPALSTLMSFSSLGVLIHVGGALVKDRVTVERAFDAHVEGQLFGNRMKSFKR